MTSLFVKCGTYQKPHKVRFTQQSDLLTFLVGTPARLCLNACINCLCLPQDSKGRATSEEECRETFTRLGRKWELSLEFMKGLKGLTHIFWTLKITTTTVSDLKYSNYCVLKGEIRPSDCNMEAPWTSVMYRQ